MFVMVRHAVRVCRVHVYVGAICQIDVICFGTDRDIILACLQYILPFGIESW